MPKLWRRVPLLLRCALVGMAVNFVGSTLAVVPLVLNLKFQRQIPWSLPVVVAVTVACWWWLSGNGAPISTADERAWLSRAESEQPRRSWLLPTAATIAALVCLRLAAPSFLPVPPPTFKAASFHLSTLALICGAIAIAISSGVVEEIAFRGYTQRPLEPRYGLLPATLFTGVLFWTAHLPDVTLAHLPGQVFASVLFGYLAAYSGSLIPPVIAHIGADLILQTAYALQKPSWIWKALSAKPVWSGQQGTGVLRALLDGMNPTVSMMAGSLLWALIVSTVLAIWALRRLGRPAGAATSA